MKLRILIILYAAVTLSLTGAPPRGLAPHTIMCFFKPAYHLQEDMPERVEIPRSTEEIQDIIANQQINGYTREGIVATYHGHVGFSNHAGEIVFPRKHTKDDMFIVVTRSIRPQVVEGETVSFFTLDAAQHTRMYYLQRKTDTEEETPYWDVSEVSVENGDRLPASAVTIFAKPENVVVPTGKFATIKGENLLLPNIYVKKSMAIGPSALAFLDVSKYFAPIRYVRKYTSDRYTTGVRP